ncbi:MAG: hypothetical protein HC846_02070 [Blastocatellia bacterium]|nr:hypothetical protein [Blastocatellia bacterium]
MISICQTGEAKLASGQIIKADTTIGTDGAGSAIRNTMLLGGVERFDFSQKWLEHGYKELHIPKQILKETSKQNRFSKWIDKIKQFPIFNQPAKTLSSKPELEFNALHIWARHSFMMIALPNFDGTFTCTLFLAHKGENSFEEIFSRRLTQINADKKIDLNLSASSAKSAADSLFRFFSNLFSRRCSADANSD